MNRSGYSDDLGPRELAMWRGRVASTVRGKRGQALLRSLLKTLDEMPEKRLIRHDLVDDDGEGCLLGAGGKAMGIVDIEKIDPEDHDVLADRFAVAECLIQEIEWENDDGGPYGAETPEQRFARMRAWLVRHIKTDKTNTEVAME